MKWPLVEEDDNGIRPAGGPDTCFYCKRKVGEEHAKDCTTILKLVKLRHSFELIVDVPDHWDEAKINAYYNQSSPMDMLYYIKKLFKNQIKNNGGYLDNLAESHRCEYIGIADNTPSRTNKREELGVDISKYFDFRGGVHKDWPSEDQHGKYINPASESDTGFKQVKIRPSFEVEENVTHHWDQDMINAYYNESCDIMNIIYDIKIWADYNEGYYKGEPYKCEYVERAKAS